ncbi:MAG TPA: hypothetical protein VEC76_13895 [Streptosporangiaceae bacterium]|nr:hypothetical protein [Streptosporangiaceae bacterium]
MHGGKSSLHYFLGHHHVVHQEHGYLGKGTVVRTVEHGYGLVSIPSGSAVLGASPQHRGYAAGLSC